MKPEVERVVRPKLDTAMVVTLGIFGSVFLLGLAFIIGLVVGEADGYNVGQRWGRKMVLWHYQDTGRCE